MPTRFHIPILVCLGLAFAAVFAAPVLFETGAIALGVECSPASRELWALWHTLLPETEGSLGFPGSGPNPTITAPTVWVLAQLLGHLGLTPIGIWNAVFLVGYLCLTLGCIALGRRISPNSPLVAQLTLLIAVVGCSAWSPVLRNLGTSAVPMMLVPLALSEVHAWVQPNASKLRGVTASALFGMACLGSWGTAALVMLMTPPLVIVVCQHIEGTQAKRRGAMALFPGLVLGAAHISATHESATGLVIDAAELGPAWMTQAEGALALPATAAVALPSIGILLLALAGIASRPQSTVGWFLSATWGILIAASDSSGLLPAVHLADTFPPLQGLDGWWVIAPLVSLPLGIAAMKGVEALHRAQRDTLALGVLGLALLDQTLPAVMVSEPQTMVSSPSSAIIDAMSDLPTGGVVALPTTDTDCAQTNRHRLWQPIVGRPFSTAPWGGSDGAQRISYIARMAQVLSVQPPNPASHDAALDPDTYRCAVQDVFGLQDLGFSALLIDKSARSHPALDAGVRMVLGEPIAEDNTAVVWAIEPPEGASRGEPCPLP